MNAVRQGQRLTVREREIVGAICAGERTAEIAQRLTISSRTVETHLQHARIKLGARTVRAAIYEYVTRYRSEI